MSVEDGIPTFPKAEDIRFKIHYPPGTKVWIYDGKPRRKKTITCPCCGEWRAFFFDWMGVAERTVTEVRVTYKGTTPEVEYHLDDGSRRNVTQVFATKNEALRFAKTWCNKMTAKSAAEFDKKKADLHARVERLLESAKTKDATAKIAAIFKDVFKEGKYR